MSARTVCENSIVVKAVVALARILLAGLLVCVLVPASPAHADTTVCGQITEDTTWTSEGNNYIVTCTATVVEGITLSIEPGVRVHFDAGTSLLVYGALIAQEVTFTSNQASPAPGDWGRIYFGPLSEDAVLDANGNYLSGSVIQGSVIVYGGGGSGVTGSIITDGASPLLDGNLVRFSYTRGIYAVGRSTTNKIVIRGNSVVDNHGGGIYVSNGELDQNVVSSNSGGDGAGIYATNSLLTENEVMNNRGYSGAGIYALGGTLSDNTVSGNSGGPVFALYRKFQGGGIYTNGGNLIGNLVTGNTISNNAGWESEGGGVYAAGGTISLNTVTGNAITSGEGKGAGICSSLSTVTENVVNTNSVTTVSSIDPARGGGIYSAGGTVTNNMVSGNTAVVTDPDQRSYGGGIYADGGIVADNMITNNVAAGGADSQGGGVYSSLNTISDNSLSGNSANRGGAIYSDKGTVTNNTITNNTTSSTGSIYMYEGTALGNTLDGNSATNGGGLYGYHATLTGNVVQNNTANLGGGILTTEGTVRGNTVTGNTAMSDGGGIYAEGGTVTGNTVTGNMVPSYGRGSGAYLLGAVDFTYNSVTENTASGGTAGGITIDGQPLVQFNNLYDNEPYDAEEISADPVTATLNYWGESLCTEISAQIYDGHDLPGRGILSYAPSLYLPVPVAQLDAPTDLAIDIDEDAVTLSWTPIDPIPDVGCRPDGYSGDDQGYSVYYSIGKPCGPYDGTGLPAGNSPINVGDVTGYALSGMDLGDYYFVVAAHDYLDRESAFTNSVCVPSTGYPIYLPLVIRSA